MTEGSGLAGFLAARFDEDEVNGTCLIGSERKDWSVRWRAEVAAKRAILAEHGSMFQSCIRCAEDDKYEPDVIRVAWPCPTVRALASVYVDHADYRPEWAS